MSAGIFVCFFIALKILTCYYQCQERRPWGRTGVCGQRERNVSLLGEVHRRHDGAPSSSGERRRREEHRVSLHFYSDSYIIMDILMNLLILFTFYSRLQDIIGMRQRRRRGRRRRRRRQRKWVATLGGGTAARRRK